MRDELFGAHWGAPRTWAALEPVYRQWGPHPAFARFLAARPSRQRLLYLTAPSGLGREWFALSWLATFGSGYILDLSEPLSQEEATLASVEEYLKAGEDRAVCVIMDAGTDPAHWQTRLSRATVRTEDLLLTHAEAAAFYAQLDELDDVRTDQPVVVTDFERAWSAVGGWLHALACVHRFGVRAGGVRDEVTWLLNSLDSYTAEIGVCRFVAFLAEIDAELLVSFFCSLALNPPAVEDLLALGLLMPVDGKYFMPTVIRAVLREQFASGTLEEAQVTFYMLRATVGTKGIGTAIKAAARHHDREGVGRFLDEYWPDVFAEDPTMLAHAQPELSEQLLNRFGDANLARRLLSAFMSGSPEAWPASPVPYHKNLTVQRLRQTLEQQPVIADARTLNMHLLFINYLRLARYHSEAAEHSRHLRKLLVISYDHYSLNPLLRAFINLVIGMNLQEDLDLDGAKEVYGEAYLIAEQEENAYMAADAAGKLALLWSLDGEFAASKDWYERAFDRAKKARWGHAVILRCALLARTFCQLHDLDFIAAEESYQQLKLDQQHLFWEFELFLRAIIGVISFEVEAPVQEARKLLASNQHGMSKAGLALVENIPDLGRLKTGATDNPLERPVPNQALVHLQTRDMDALASVLQRISIPHFGIHRRLVDAAASYLTLGSEATTAEIAYNLQRSANGRFSLLEILILSLLPNAERIADHLDLSEDELAALAEAREKWSALYEIPPELTPREAEVLDLLRQGLSRAEIAQRTYRSENTVKAQLRSLYKKLNVSNRSQALKRARLLGI